MRYRVHEPSTPLNACIDHLWSLSDAPGHARERIVPSGTLELVINLHEDELRVYDDATGSCRRFRGAVVSGCYGAPFGIDTRAHASVVGVHFRPGGAAGLLGVPPGELGDRHVALEELWGRQATALRERLCSASATRQRFELLEQALLARLRHARPARDAVVAALPQLERPRASVGDAARALALSRRRFIELFTEDVGMTPKRYARVRRFQRALALALRGRSPAWATLALESGYYDQAHLCRDWAELAGLSPAAFVALRATRVKENHVALPEGQVKSVQDPAAAGAYVAHERRT